MQRAAVGALRRASAAAQRVSMRACSSSATAAEEQGSSTLFDALVYGAAAVGIGYAGYNLYGLYTEWPEGCQALLEQVNRDQRMLQLFGGSVSRGSGWSGMWEGKVEPDRMNVMIPVEGPASQGQLHCAAIKDGEGAWVVLLLEAHILKTALQPPALMALAPAAPSALEGGEGGDTPPSSPPLYTPHPDSPPILVFDIMRGEWLGSSYVIGAATPTAAAEAHTAAKVVVVPPSPPPALHTPSTVQSGEGGGPTPPLTDQ